MFQTLETLQNDLATCVCIWQETKKNIHPKKLCKVVVIYLNYVQGCQPCGNKMSDRHLCFYSLALNCIKNIPGVEYEMAEILSGRNVM